MDTKSEKTIKEVIEDVLKFRNRDLSRVLINKHNVYKEARKNRTIQEIKDRYDNTLIKLNNLLKVDERYKEVINIEQHMKKIQAKRIISVKEFKDIYSYSPEWQRNRRYRIHNALPFIQTVEGGKITYDVKKVNNWFENENIAI